MRSSQPGLAAASRELRRHPPGPGRAQHSAPHRSLPAAVVATPSLRRSRTPSPRDLQPAARYDPSRRSPSGSPSAWRPFPRPATSRSMLPGPQRAGEPRGNGPALPRTRNGDRKAEWTAFRLPVPRATERSRAWCRGCAKGGAFLPSGLNRPAAVSIRLPDRRPVARPDRAHHPAGRTRRSRRRTPRRPAARRPGRRRAAAARCLHAATGTRPAAQSPARARMETAAGSLRSPFRPRTNQAGTHRAEHGSGLADQRPSRTPVQPRPRGPHPANT